MKLDYLQALKRVTEAQGAWVMHGQEPLLEQNLRRCAAIGKVRKLNDNAMKFKVFRTGKMSLMP
jgi:uncharacterized lipoprotein YddW (UPF0748 family)